MCLFIVSGLAQIRRVFESPSFLAHSNATRRGSWHVVLHGSCDQALPLGLAVAVPVEKDPIHIGIAVEQLGSASDLCKNTIQNYFTYFICA